MRKQVPAMYRRNMPEQARGSGGVSRRLSVEPAGERELGLELRWQPGTRSEGLPGELCHRRAWRDVVPFPKKHTNGERLRSTNRLLHHMRFLPSRPVPDRHEDDTDGVVPVSGDRASG